MEETHFVLSTIFEIIFIVASAAFINYALRRCLIVTAVNVSIWVLVLLALGRIWYVIHEFFDLSAGTGFFESVFYVLGALVLIFFMLQARKTPTASQVRNKCENICKK